jgi:hypothetical protein
MDHKYVVDARMSNEGARGLARYGWAGEHILAGVRSAWDERGEEAARPEQGRGEGLGWKTGGESATET